MNDTTNLHVLYGFKTPFFLDLDEADATWLEGNAVGCAYARSRAALPIGYWLNEGCVAELADYQVASRHDPRVRATRYGAVIYLRNSSDAVGQPSPGPYEITSLAAGSPQWRPRASRPASHVRVAIDPRIQIHDAAAKESV